VTRWLTAVALFAALLAAQPACAVQPDEVLSDPKLEARARTLSRELRCMVCQNQSIDDSEAPLARDLRLLVRERLKAGDSDSAVIDFLVARYGEFVLLRPRFEWQTAVLWLMPPAVLAVGAVIAFAVLRRRRQGTDLGPDASRDRLSPEEEARLKKLIAQEAASASNSAASTP
jgi:cytochrome c-type biogenesis protein CcmH